MHKLVLKMTRDQAGALLKALSVFVRLCRRDFKVLRELVEAGFIPVFDGSDTWRSRPATPDVLAEMDWIIAAIGGVIGQPLDENEAIEGAGGSAESLARRVETVLAGTQSDVIVVVGSLEEGQAAAEALDAFTRLGIGQIVIVDEMVRFGTVRVLTADGGPGHADLKAVHRCEAMFARMRAALNFSAGQSLGVGNRSVRIEAHRAWEVCKVVRQVLAMHRDPAPAFRGVHYDGLELRYTQDPKPTAEVCTDQA